MDKQLKKELIELKLKKLLGSANKCPKCKKEGYFGSIIRYDGKGDDEYLICGWCGKITKIKEKPQ